VKTTKEYAMNFINVRLLTGDFSAAVGFWRDTIGLKMTYGDEAMGYAYFETGTAGIEILRRDEFAASLGDAPGPTPEGHQAVLVFRVDDVDATYRDLVARGVTPVAAPQDRPAWNARTAPFRAHDGYLVEIYSPLHNDR